jgi:hypothetical protein
MTHRTTQNAKRFIAAHERVMGRSELRDLSTEGRDGGAEWLGKMRSVLARLR